MMPGYERPAHIQRIADSLEALECGDINRLMILMPPRHGKSELASTMFPSWFLARNPGKQIISASYNEELSSDFGRKVRDRVSEEEFTAVFPDAKIKDTSHSACRWHLQTGSQYIASGVGGSITGRGADVGIIDDPIKDRKSAESLVIRNAVWDWYTSTFYTRLMPGGRIVLIQTRWHQDDLAGRLLEAEKHGGDKWTILNLPAINEQGEALWPEWFPLEQLERIRRVIGPRDWAALYQQSPTAPGGNIFKREWFRFLPFHQFPQLDEYEDLIQIWDTAFKEEQENDPCACMTLGLKQNNFYLVDVLNRRMEWPELMREADVQYRKFHPRLILIEDKASGISLIQALSFSTLLPVFPVQAIDSKVARATSVTGLVESSRCIVPEDAIWADAFLSQLCNFPNDVHDDMVDGYVHGLRYYMLRENEDFTFNSPKQNTGLSLGLNSPTGY